MTDLNILIVEGNDPKNNEFFVKAAKASCSQNLKNLVSLGVDHIDFTLNPKVEKYFMLKTLKKKDLQLYRCTSLFIISPINLQNYSAYL